MPMDARQTTKATVFKRFSFQLVDLCLALVGICVFLEVARWSRLEFLPVLLTVIAATLVTAVTEIKATRRRFPWTALAGAVAWSIGAAIVRVFQPSIYDSPLASFVWCVFPIYGAVVCMVSAWMLAKAIHFARLCTAKFAVGFRAMVTSTLFILALLVITGERFFGTPTAIPPAGSIKCCGSPVRSLVFDDDGRKLVAGCEDGTLSILTTYDRRLLATTTLGTSLYAVALSSDYGFLLSGGSDCQVSLWDPSNMTLLRTLSSHRDSIRSLAVSPDGSLIISGSGSSSKGLGEIKLWDSAGGTLLATHAWPGEISSLACSRSGELLAASNSGWNVVKLLNTKSLTVIHALEGHTQQVRGVAFSPDRAYLATVASSGSQSPEVFIWNVESRQITRRLHVSPCFLSSVAFSSDGTAVFAGGSEGVIFQWSMVSGDLLQILRGHRTEVCSLAISPKHSVVAAGGRDGTITLWEAKQ